MLAWAFCELEHSPSEQWLRKAREGRPYPPLTRPCIHPPLQNAGCA